MCRQVLLRQQGSGGGSRRAPRTCRSSRAGHRQTGQLAATKVPVGPVQEVGDWVEGSQRGIGERETGFAVAQADDWNVWRKRRG